jgi:adenosylcobinamide hydrolase
MNRVDGLYDMLLAGIVASHVDDSSGDYLLIESAEELRTLNSAPWGGGFQISRRLVNRQVDKSYLCDDPVTEMEQFLRGRGIEAAGTASMLTAARVADVGFAVSPTVSNLTVSAWVTVGLGNPARSGAERPQSELFPGTINTIVLIDGNPTDAAMVNAVITATEAKTAVLQDLAVSVPGVEGSAIATGTTTDAVLIAATGRGRPIRYAGPATELGHWIGRTVYQATNASAKKYFDWVSNRPNK